MDTEKERKKRMQAVVYGPPPRPDEANSLDELFQPKTPDDSKFYNIVYGPPPRKDLPKKKNNEEDELLKRLSE